MNNPVAVKWFDSTMSGAPVLSGQAGALIGVLDACLLADGSGGGFGTVTLSSLEVASSVATATVNTGHGFLDHVVVKVAGATPSGLNGDKRITRIGTNTFTFDATGISDQTATGTITAKMSPLGWVKTYSGTHKAAYARSSVQATAMLLRVNDTGTTLDVLNMYETMSDVDTGTGDSGAVYTLKSGTANSTARPWRLYADDRAALLAVDGGGNNVWTGGFFFGDINAYRSGDAYHCLLIAGDNSSGANYLTDLSDAMNCTANSLLCRAWHQTRSAIAAGKYSHSKCTSSGIGGSEYPSLTDNGLHIWPIEIWDGTVRARGLLPGIYSPVHAADSISDNTTITDVGALGGATVKIQYINGSNPVRCVAVNITGPWR